MVKPFEYLYNEINHYANGGGTMKLKVKYIPFLVKSEKEIAESLTEKDFRGAPITEEHDGDYQMIEIYGTTYYRNVETGEVDY